MSLETRDLMQTYSDIKVARAKSFLQQRQQEVQHLTDRLILARRTCDLLRHGLGDVVALPKPGKWRPCTGQHSA